MVRLDSTSNEDISGLKKDMEVLKKELGKKQNKKLFSCFNLFLAGLVVLAVLAGYVMYLLSLTGLVTVPYFSQKFYHQPQPLYAVQPSTMSEQTLVNKIKTDLVSQARIAGKLPAEITVNLKDQELTAWLNSLTKDMPSVGLSQVAVAADSLEIFAAFKDPAVYVTLGVSPQPTADGGLEFKVNQVKVGNLQLPDFVGEIIFKKLLFDSISRLNTVVFKDIKVQSVSFKNPAVSFNLLVNKIPNAF